MVGSRICIPCMCENDLTVNSGKKLWCLLSVTCWCTSGEVSWKYMLIIIHFNIWKTTFTYVNTCRKKYLKIQYVYLGSKEIYCTLKTFCIIPVLFSTKLCLFNNFVFFGSNNTFFINCGLKFKYPLLGIKVNGLRLYIVLSTLKLLPLRVILHNVRDLFYHLLKLWKKKLGL